MKGRLLISLASLLICGANAAIAQHPLRSSLARTCMDFNCNDGGKASCQEIGCSNCSQAPSGMFCSL